MSNIIIKKNTPKKAPIVIGTVEKLPSILDVAVIGMTITMMTIKARKAKKGKKTSFLPDANVRLIFSID